ncbi:MAG: hypothetical protein LBQ81_12205 [Zoogloeaceae bacterium]|jgi:hypothetical protein|nr:hypothetical protein [Zoogloeaceae bacterium]
MMTLAEIRLKQNPVLTNLLLSLKQSGFIAERLMPRLPQALRGMTLAKLGNERLRQYDLRRAPGAATKRVDIRYNGQTYTVNQYSVEVPIPRELIQESEAAQKISIVANLDVSRIAMTTANDILALDYEIEVAALANDPASYAAGNVLALSGATQWSAAIGEPVTDIRNASNAIRAATGVRPNTLELSYVAWRALEVNPQVKSYLPDSVLGPATLDQLKTILDVSEIIIGDAIRLDDADVAHDVWGNNAVLAYVPSLGGANGDVSLAQPAFGFTSVLEGNPFAEAPYYEANLKSWVYGATYERQPHIAYNTAGFLFQNAA